MKVNARGLVFSLRTSAGKRLAVSMNLSICSGVPLNVIKQYQRGSYFNYVSLCYSSQVLVTNINNSCCELAAVNTLLAVFGSGSIMDLPCNESESLTLALKEVIGAWVDFERNGLPRLEEVMRIIKCRRTESLRHYCDYITGCIFGEGAVLNTENEVHISYFVLISVLRKEHHSAIGGEKPYFDGKCSCLFFLSATVQARSPSCCSSTK